MIISLVTGEPSTTTEMAESVGNRNLYIWGQQQRKKTVTRNSSLHSLQQISTSSEWRKEEGKSLQPLTLFGMTGSLIKL